MNILGNKVTRTFENKKKEIAKTIQNMEKTHSLDEDYLAIQINVIRNSEKV